MDLYKDKLSVNTTVGYTLAINNSYGSSGFSEFTEELENGDVISGEDLATYNFRKTYNLIETGVGVEYKLKNAISLYLAMNYLTGFKRVVEVNVAYQVNDKPEQIATVFSNGDYHSLVFGVRYPISNFWNKKEQD